MGLRPKWPPNIPQMWLRELIEACWDQEANERPAAFQVLRALVAYQEHVTSAGNHAILKEQEHVDGYPEESTFLDRL